MLIRKPEGWEIPEREVTPESAFLNRRQINTGLTTRAIIILFLPAIQKFQPVMRR